MGEFYYPCCYCDEHDKQSGTLRLISTMNESPGYIYQCICPEPHQHHTLIVRTIRYVNNHDVMKWLNTGTKVGI